MYLQCPNEFDLRNTLVTLTQNVLLVLRAANCLLPCVQWYACMLRGLHTGPTQPLCVPERDATLPHKPPSPGSFLKDFNMDCCCFSQGVHYFSPCMFGQLIYYVQLCSCVSMPSVTLAILNPYDPHLLQLYCAHKYVTACTYHSLFVQFSF